MDTTHNEPMDWTAILSKLEQVRTLRDRATTQGEAEAAAAALTRLLTKYNLSMAEFEMRTKSERAEGHGMIRDFIDMANSAPWRSDLLNVIAMHNGCRAIFGLGKKAIMVGTKQNIALIEDIYSEFVALAEVMARRASREPAHARDVMQSGIRSWKTGYLTGFSSGLGDAMREARRQAVGEMEGGSALVVVEKKRLDDAVADLVGITRGVRASSVNAAGYRAGHSDGKGALTRRIDS